MENAGLIQYSIYTQSDAEEMVGLLAETFSRRDPPAVAVGVTMDEFAVLARLYCPKASVEGLTIVARSSETGEMAGALLAEDSASEPPPGVEGTSPTFLPIFGILGELEQAYRGGNAPGKGESLHLFLLGVAERFSGQGIAGQLVARCVENGARLGYRVAVAEATNRTSQHIFRKLGFIERAQASYRDYRFEGRAAFESIAAEGGPILMERVL